MKWSHYCLIFIMRIPIPGKTVLYWNQALISTTATHVLIRDFCLDSSPRGSDWFVFGLNFDLWILGSVGTLVNISCPLWSCFMVFNSLCAESVQRKVYPILLTIVKPIRVKSPNCGCLVTWFCYQLIAKPGNKTATVSWLDPYKAITESCGRGLSRQVVFLILQVSLVPL